VQWDTVSDTSVTDYRVYWGFSSGNYVSSQDVGTRSDWYIPNLPDGQPTYVVVTARRQDGSESGYSNEVILMPTTAPVAHWTFDGNATDTSGNNINGTLVGSPTFPAGRIGSGALQLDGSTQYMQVSCDALLEPQAVTVSMCVKRNAVQVARAALISKSTSYALSLNTSGNNAGQLSWLGLTTPVDVVPENRWTHVMATYNPSDVVVRKSLWVNCVRVAHDDSSDPIVYDASDLFVGRFYSGLIDDVQIFPFGATQNTVQVICRSSRCAQ
jgi:hypothetical protein